MSDFLWGVFPYICLGLFLLVPIIRMVYRPFGFSTRASGLFGKSVLGVASLTLHWGLFLLLCGHLAGFLGGLMGLGPWITFFYWVGMAGGFLVLVGSAIALVRRFRVPEVRAMSQWDDYVVHLFLLTLVSLGLYQVLVDRIFGVAYTASAWLASLTRLAPQPELLASATFVSKLHIVVAFAFLALFPFTKLVHLWTYPVNYFVRPYQSVRTDRYTHQRRWELRLRSDRSFLLFAVAGLVLFFGVASWLLLGHPSNGAKAPGPETSDGRLAGYPLYVSQCARCHGLEGRGDGPGAGSPTFARRPRDLTKGAYHFISTDNAVASDADLARTIRRGLPPAGMPAFGQMSDEQVDSLVAVLGGMWGAARPASGTPFLLPPREPAGASADRGLALFGQHCVVCHGTLGRGDGAAAQGLQIKPANLAAGAVKAGTAPEDLYWRIAAGIPPAAMPGFGAALKPEEIYSIVIYLRERILPRAVASR